MKKKGPKPYPPAKRPSDDELRDFIIGQSCVTVYNKLEIGVELLDDWMQELIRAPVDKKFMPQIETFRRECYAWLRCLDNRIGQITNADIEGMSLEPVRVLMDDYLGGDVGTIDQIINVARNDF